MITNTDVNSFVASLSGTFQQLVETIGHKEDWTCDNDDEIQPLINQLSESLNRTPTVTLQQTSHLLLANIAFFSLERFITLVHVLSKKDPYLIASLVDDSTASLLEEDGALYLRTVISRFIHIVQSSLIAEIFDPIALTNIKYALQDASSQSSGQSDNASSDEVLQSDPQNNNESFDDFPELNDIAVQTQQHNPESSDLRANLFERHPPVKGEAKVDKNTNDTADMPMSVKDTNDNIISTKDVSQVVDLLEELINSEDEK